MAPRLPVVDVAVAGLSRAVQSLPRLLAIYWLPWLVGTAALIVLEIILQDQLRLGRAPEWARSLVWSPFAAWAYLVLLRWILWEQVPARLAILAVGSRVWLAAPIVAAWLLTFDAISAGPLSLLTWFSDAEAMAFRWDDVTNVFNAFRLAAWLVNAALDACFFGLLVIVAGRGWLDLRELWRLLSSSPINLFSIALVAAAATGGAQHLQAYALAWLSLDQHASVSMIPWRANVHRAFAVELVSFPFAFLGFAIQGCILAEAYRRLTHAPETAKPQAAPAP
jgi:hypothetical protein